MRHQNPSYLPCQQTYFRNPINYFTGSSDRNRQPDDGAYQHKNYPDIRQDNERENQSRYGNPFAQTVKFEKADYGTDYPR